MLATKWGQEGSGGAEGSGRAVSLGAKVRDSLTYVNELKKQQSILATFEKKDGRSSILTGEALRKKDMKKQSITVDMDLHEEGDPSERLKHAAKAAKERKNKRKAGRISASDIIKETDETKQEDLSML
jgi:hypothetical protein